MDKRLQTNKEILFMHQVLLSRLGIRDFFLKTTVREVYENVGQLLSLVRLELANTELIFKEEAKGNIPAAGNLVGQSIRELRAMCRSFYPDEDITKDDGFILTLTNVTEVVFSIAEPAITIKGKRKDIEADLQLIIFKMLQDIMIAIQEAGGNFVSTVIYYGKEEVKFTVQYTGEVIRLSHANKSDDTPDNLTLQERIQLIKGRMELSKSRVGINRVQLVSPLKSNQHG